jgi:hypothetical protein
MTDDGKVMVDDVVKIEELAKLSPLEYDRVRAEEAKKLGCTVPTLNTLVKKAREQVGHERRLENLAKALEPVSEEEMARIEEEKAKLEAERVAKLEESAAGIIESTSVLDLFADEIAKVIAGERNNAKLLFLIATSRILRKPMHAAVKGPSAGGKSELREAVLEFMPPESVIAFTSLSEKAIIYDDRDYAHKILSMGEAAANDEQSFQDYILREFMSAGRLVHFTTIKVDGEMIGSSITKEGPVAFMVTTTKNKLHPENETRMWSLEVDDSEEQTARVLKKIAEVEGLGTGKMAIDYEPWRDFQRWLETVGSRSVVVPFAGVLAERTRAMSVRLRRDFGQIMHAVMVHAILQRAHRKRDEFGRIVASIADYRVVYDLMHEGLAVSSEAKVSGKVQQTVDAVRQITADRDEGATVMEVAAKLRLDRSAAQRRLYAAQHAGLLLNSESRKGHPNAYRLTGQTITAAGMLPTAEALSEYMTSRPLRNPLHSCTPHDFLEELQEDTLCKDTNTQPAPCIAQAPLSAVAVAQDSMPENSGLTAVVQLCSDFKGAEVCSHCRCPATPADPLSEWDGGVDGEPVWLHRRCEYPWLDEQTRPETESTPRADISQ